MAFAFTKPKNAYVVDHKTGQVSQFGGVGSAMDYANQLEGHYSAGGGSAFGGSPMSFPAAKPVAPLAGGFGSVAQPGQISTGGTAAVNGAAAGGMNPAASKLMADYAAKYNEARGSNIARYDEGKQGYQDRYDRNIKLLDNSGAQQMADIRNRADAAKGANRTRLADLGLSGTTVGASLDAGVDREANAATSRAQEQINQQKIQTDAQLSGDKLGFIERRNDLYPDLGSYASLIGSLGAAGITDLSGMPGSTGAVGTTGTSTGTGQNMELPGDIRTTLQAYLNSGQPVPQHLQSWLQIYMNGKDGRGAANRPIMQAPKDLPVMKPGDTPYRPMKPILR